MFSSSCALFPGPTRVPGVYLSQKDNARAPATGRALSAGELPDGPNLNIKGERIGHSVVLSSGSLARARTAPSEAGDAQPLQ